MGWLGRLFIGPKPKHEAATLARLLWNHLMRAGG
jgi:hypothetical protein